MEDFPDPPPHGFLWLSLPTILLSCFIGLAVFTAVLEYRGWVDRTNKEAQRLQLATLVRPTLDAERLERQVLVLRRLGADLEDWHQAKIAWAAPLLDVTAHIPTNLALKRVVVRESLGGSFFKPDVLLSARFVPRRDYRVQLEGQGLTPDIAGLVADYSHLLARSGSASNVLRQMVLQGILTKPASDAGGAEFSLLATGSVGRDP